MSSGRGAVEANEPDELICGRRASRAGVIAAGPTDDDIDRLINQVRTLTRASNDVK
jgi:hypothetical protein